MTDPSGRPALRRVLIIEDADPTRDLITRILARVCGEIRGVADGLTGLEVARAWLPDAIVLDLALPGLGGWEVLGELRADPATAGIPVVLTTAHAAPEVKVRAKREGVAAFITKPFEPSELRSAVVSQFGSRSAA